MQEKHTIDLSEAAHRWLQHHSILEPGDAVLLGASNVTQVKANLKSWCVVWSYLNSLVRCPRIHQNYHGHSVKVDHSQSTS